MEWNLKIGMIGKKSETVTPNTLASTYGSGGVDVYSTPAMIGLIEGAALSGVDPYLPEGHVTVGVHLDVAHLGATLPGLKVEAEAKLIEIKGRKLLFEVEARDENKVIGKGTHMRAIVELESFLKQIGL